MEKQEKVLQDNLMVSGILLCSLFSILSLVMLNYICYKLFICKLVSNQLPVLSLLLIEKSEKMDSEEYRKKKQEATKKWLKENIPLANNIKNEAFSKLILLSIIDCFAQAYAGYSPYHTSKVFSDFIIKFSITQSSHLQNVCPITLGYEYNIKPRLVDGMLYYYDDPYLAKEGERILQMLPEVKRSKARQKHCYAGLLYATRNKLAHELNTLGHRIDFCNGKPTIASGRLLDYVDGKIVETIEWNLFFPKKYIYDLVNETVYGYLDYCNQEKKLLAPIGVRRSRYTWYD